MFIRFPFTVTQKDKHTVQVDTSINGQPLISLNLHPVIRDKVSDKVMDAITEHAVKEVVKDTMTVSLDVPSLDIERHDRS